MNIEYDFELQSKQRRNDYDDIGHAETRIGDSVVMMFDAKEE
jgi:uncharacterized glyoxalase superfamily protein PhnB